MGRGKTATLTLRIDPGVKEGLRIIAAREHRSLANMIEMMIRDYCGRAGVTVPTQEALFGEEREPD
jgi:hypothetical protein